MVTKLILDETKIEQKENVVLVTRTIVEEYGADDYLESLNRLQSTIDQMTDKQDETRVILDMILDEKIKKRCEDILEEKKVLQAKEVADAIAKQKTNK